MTLHLVAPRTASHARRRASGPSPTVRAAMAVVPRSAFPAREVTGDERVPAVFLPTEQAVAQVLDALELSGTEQVLWVGAGVGYAAAVCAQLCARLHVLEPLPALASAVRPRLERFACGSAVTVVVGPAEAGLADQAPYDVIVCGGPWERAPAALVGQVGPGGRLVYLRPESRASLTIVRAVRRGEGAELEETSLGTLDLTGELRAALAASGLGEPDLTLPLKRLLEGRADAEREARRLLSAPETELVRELAAHRGWAFGEAERLLDELDPALAARVRPAFLQANHVLPVRRRGDAVVVATSDPDVPVGDVEQALPGERLVFALVPPSTLRRLRANLGLRGGGAEGGVGHPGEQRASPDDMDEADEHDVADAHRPPDARLVALFDGLMLDAIGQRASDVHLERYGTAVRVRFRIDGDLLDVPRYAVTPRQLVGLVNVIKIRADLDIAERRRPQGGRLGLRAGAQRFDVRVQTQPTLHGEHVVLRLLPQDARLLTIADLGFPPACARRYRRLLDAPNGLVLVVGPTGSGKSTTLYAGLQILAQDATRKVITVEDPIEYSIPGIQQSAARPEIGFAFHDAMRAFVREDPDVILVGEIRDGETALEALRASQTGHLVLSTLHCNDAVDAVQRLLDLGMHPSSIGAELLAVIAQRLVRRVCPACAAPAAPDSELLGELFPRGAPATFACRAGAGCAACDGRGTRGRIAVVELLEAGPALRAAIARRAGPDELRRLALDGGMSTLRAHALELVQSGQIPLAELRAILPPERLAGDA